MIFYWLSSTQYKGAVSYSHNLQQPITGYQVDFNLRTQVLSNEEVFSSNTSNKQNFTNLLSTALRNEEHGVIICLEDADMQIV